LRLERLLGARKARHRRGLLLGEHAGLYDLADVFAHTDAMRWLNRSLHHLERLEHYRGLGHAVLPATRGSDALNDTQPLAPSAGPSTGG
jgi:phosphate:Na+ symporter